MVPLRFGFSAHVSLFLVAVSWLGCGSSSDSWRNGPLGGDQELPDDIQVFPDENAWNTDISMAPVDLKSDDYIASIGLNTGLHADFSSTGYGIPFTVVPADQALVPITFTLYDDESDPGPYPIPSDAPIEGGSDAHAIIVDPENGFLYELYRAQH